MELGCKLTELKVDIKVPAQRMLRLRYWQHILNERLKRGHFKIPIHLAFGHEAIAVALSTIINPDDSLCLTHRNIVYNLAREEIIEPILDMYELKSNVDRANMGSMNLALSDHGIHYASSILGNNLAVAAGIALNRRVRQRPGVSFVVTGDGAIEEGVFWEVLLHARSHNLPLVILVEDNNYSLASTISERRCPIDLGLICEGLKISFQELNGADYFAIHSGLCQARELAIQGEPSCISVNVKTFCQHAGPTPGWPGDTMEINIANGMILGEDPTDPLFNLRLLLGDIVFKEIEESVVAHDYSS